MCLPLSLPSRRTAVAVAALVLVAVAVGGAVALGIVGDGETALDQVPNEADVVGAVDPAIVDDRRTWSLLEGGLASAGYGGVDVDEVSETIDSQSDAALQRMDAIVAYGRYDATGQLDRRYAGVIVHANVSSGPVIVALTGATGVQYDESDVGETTVYRPQASPDGVAPTVAMLADEEYAIGTEPAVADAVAVANGESRALGGPLRTTFDATERGLVTVGARVPRERIPDSFARLDEYTRLGSVRAITVAYDSTAEGIGLRMRLRANGTAAARDVAGITSSGLTFGAARTENDTVTAVLDSIAVEREGQDVRIDVEVTVEELRRVAAYYGFGSVP